MSQKLQELEEWLLNRVWSFEDEQEDYIRFAFKISQNYINEYANFMLAVLDIEQKRLGDEQPLCAPLQRSYYRLSKPVIDVIRKLIRDRM